MLRSLLTYTVTQYPIANIPKIASGRRITSRRKVLRRGIVRLRSIGISSRSPWPAKGRDWYLCLERPVAKAVTAPAARCSVEAIFIS
jgi:hypothetical protein